MKTIVVSLRIKPSILAKAMDGLSKVGDSPETLAETVYITFLHGINRTLGIDAMRGATESSIAKVQKLHKQRTKRTKTQSAEDNIFGSLTEDSKYSDAAIESIEDPEDKIKATYILQNLNSGAVTLEANLASEDSEIVRITNLLNLAPQEL